MEINGGFLNQMPINYLGRHVIHSTECHVENNLIKLNTLIEKVIEL